VVALQEEITNHRKVRRLRAGVLSVAEKACREHVRCGPRRRAEANHSMTCRKRIDESETGVESLLRDESGRYLLTGQVLSGMKVARAWSWRLCGTCEPGSRYCRRVRGGESERSKQPKLRGVE